MREMQECDIMWYLNKNREEWLERLEEITDGCGDHETSLQFATCHDCAREYITIGCNLDEHRAEVQHFYIGYMYFRAAYYKNIDTLIIFGSRWNGK